MAQQMAKFEKRNTASSEDWLLATLDVLRERGIEGVKVVVIAKRLGLTSGSFYWHFKNVQELLEAVLEYWENELTIHIIEDARSYDGPPEERIYNLMHQVIEEDAAMPDGAIAVWAKSDSKAEAAFRRTISKRFNFAGWMFEQVGFSPEEAAIRGRIMVTTLMGETENGLKDDPDWESVLRREWRVLMGSKLSEIDTVR